MALLNKLVRDYMGYFPTYETTNVSDLERAKAVMFIITADPKRIPDVKLPEKDQNHAESLISAGNVFFAEGDFANALELFNGAIMNAPANSAPYIKGFGTRSKCLSVMGLYKEGLLSVEHALKCTGMKSGYEEDLLRQKKFCKLFEGSSRISSCPNDSLPLIRDKYLTSASNKVAISTHPSVGRLLKATADIRTGEVVMIEEPYARVLKTKLHSKHCWNCTKYCEDPHPCLNCCYAMFCSQNCLEEAKKYHDFECPIMGLLIESYKINNLQFLALRMFLTAIEGGTKLNELNEKADNIEAELEKSTTYDSNDFIRIYSLLYHPTAESVLYYWYNTFLAGFIIYALSKKTNTFEDADMDLQVFACSLLVRFILIVECNSETVWTRLNPGLVLDAGHGIFAAFSLFNHSCDPNVYRNFLNQSLVLRASKPVKAGEELNISYGGHFATQSTSSRQDSQKVFNFICRCKACELDWPLYPLQQSTLPKFKKPMDDTTQSRYIKLCNKFTDNFQFEWKDNDIQFKNAVEYTPEILDSLCELVDLMTEYFDYPWQQYTEALKAARIGFIHVPDYQRS